MGNRFLSFVSSVCGIMPQLESAITEGYMALDEVAEGSDDSDGQDTITMDLDSLKKNADQIQATLQKKRDLDQQDKQTTEQLIALGNDDSAEG